MVVVQRQPVGDVLANREPSTNALADRLQRLVAGRSRYQSGLRRKQSPNAGAVVSTPVMTIDILPTIAALTGAPLPAKPLDGVNIVRLLSGQQQVPHRELFWKRGDLEAARLGKWKLVDQGGADMLFDLTVSPPESRDVAASNPAKRLELRAKLEDWKTTLAPPLW